MASFVVGKMSRDGGCSDGGCSDGVAVLASSS